MFTAVCISLLLRDGITDSQRIECPDLLGHPLVCLFRVQALVCRIIPYKTRLLQINNTITHLQLCPTIVLNVGKDALPTLNSNYKVLRKLKGHGFKWFIRSSRPTCIHIHWDLAHSISFILDPLGLRGWIRGFLSTCRKIVIDRRQQRIPDLNFNIVIWQFNINDRVLVFNPWARHNI